jgi:hypothetical protein
MVFYDQESSASLAYNNGDSSRIVFSGKRDEDVKVFVDDFKALCLLKGLTVEQAILMLRLVLNAEAKSWYVNQQYDENVSLEQRLEMLVLRFSPANVGFVRYMSYRK